MERKVNSFRNTLRDYLIMTAGTLFLTFGVYFFKIPNGFAMGGVSGIGTLLGKITPISPATWISAINILLLLIGFAVLGKDTGIRTVYCSLLFSALTQLLEFIVPLDSPMTDEPFLELIYAILLTAIGSAAIFHCGGSSGGTDIVALILKKFTPLNVGKALLCTDSIITASAFLVFGIKTGLFSLLGLFAKAFVIDGVIENMNSCKYFNIVTTQPDKISEFIMTEMHHSATLISSKGAYTNNNKTMLLTVCRRVEAIRLQKKIREIDPNAFVVITTSSEIIGRGFRGV